MKGYEFRSGMSAYLRRLGRSLDRQVTVEWDNISTPCIDLLNNIITLPSVADDQAIPSGLIERYTAYVVHEILHALWTEKIRVHEPYIHALANGLEDARIERKAIAEGLVGNARGLLTGLLRGMVAEADRVDWSDPRQYPFSLAVFCRQYGFTVPVPAALLPVWQEAERRISVATCYADSIQIARWVYDQIQTAAQNASRTQSESKSASTSGRGKRGQGDASPGPGTHQDAGEVQMPGDAAASPEPQVMVPGGGKAGTWSEGPSNWKYTGGPARPAAPPPPAGLSHSVRRLLDNSGHDQWDRRLSRGQIDAGRLHAAHTGSVFQRRREIDGIDSAVVLAIDCSSSMNAGAKNGGDIRVAAAAAEQLVRTLDRAQARTGIVLFGTGAQIAAPIGTPAAKAAQICRGITANGTTATAEAVRLSAEMLYATREERRVLLVITDGAANNQELLKERVRAAEACGVIVIGIGIGSNSVQHAFTRHVVIQDVNDLARVALEQIREAA